MRACVGATCSHFLQLMTSEGNAWLYKNKDHGMMSAAASLGSILLWNVEEGLTQVQLQAWLDFAPPMLVD